MDELACPLHVNQAGGFQFLDVVGECCGRDSQGGEGFRAAQGTGGRGDTLQEFKPMGIGQRFQDGGAARTGQLDRFGNRRRLNRAFPMRQPLDSFRSSTCWMVS